MVQPKISQTGIGRVLNNFPFRNRESRNRQKIHIIFDSVQIMATAFAWCISAVVKIAPESEIIRFLFYPGPIRDLSGFYPRVSDRQKIHITSDSVQIMATACVWCISAVVKIATESEIIQFFLSASYPGSIRSLE